MYSLALCHVSGTLPSTCETLRSRCCVAFNFEVKERRCFLLASHGAVKRVQDPAKQSTVASANRVDGCTCGGPGFSTPPKPAAPNYIGGPPLRRAPSPLKRAPIMQAEAHEPRNEVEHKVEYAPPREVEYAPIGIAPDPPAPKKPEVHIGLG